LRLFFGFSFVLCRSQGWIVCLTILGTAALPYLVAHGQIKASVGPGVLAKMWVGPGSAAPIAPPI